LTGREQCGNPLHGQSEETMDRDKVKNFADKVFGDMAGAMTAGMGYVGVKTGLFRVMAGTLRHSAPPVQVSPATFDFSRRHPLAAKPSRTTMQRRTPSPRQAVTRRAIVATAAVMAAAPALAEECPGVAGATRFKDGLGRHGDFERIR
jgi:hypothetical protein